jgi:FAD synthetase
LLEWSNRDIWDYILENKINYCSLYNEGFSSIGTKKNTVPNPYLIEKDKILHPSALDDQQERSGRIMNLKDIY